MNIQKEYPNEAVSIWQHKSLSANVLSETARKTHSSWV